MVEGNRIKLEGDLATTIVEHCLGQFPDLTPRQKRKQEWWKRKAIEELTSVSRDYIHTEPFVYLHLPPDLGFVYGDPVRDYRLEKNEKIQMLIGSVRPRSFYCTMLNEMSMFAKEERLQAWLFCDGKDLFQTTAEESISWLRSRLDKAMSKYGYSEDEDEQSSRKSEISRSSSSEKSEWWLEKLEELKSQIAGSDIGLSRHLDISPAMVTHCRKGRRKLPLHARVRLLSELGYIINWDVILRVLPPKERSAILSAHKSRPLPIEISEMSDPNAGLELPPEWD